MTYSIQIQKITLCFLTIIYIFILNFFSQQGFINTISAIWCALLLLIIFLISNLLPRLILKILLIIHIIIASIAIFAKQKYAITITEDILLSALTSEIDLTLEMISVNFIFWAMFTAILPSIIVLKIKVAPVFLQTKPICQHFIKTTVWILLCFALSFAIVWFKGYQFRNAGHIRDDRFTYDLSHFSPLDVTYNFNRARKAYKNLKNRYGHLEILSQKYHYSTEIEDLLVVFVLGETTRGDHLALNGYPRNTTPLLSQIKNLYSFKNVQSCDTLTIHSVHCLASPMLKHDNERIPKQSSFGEIFHSLGYRNEIYSLQTLSEFYKYLHYDKLITKYSVLNEQNVGAKDIALLPYAKQSIQNYQHGKLLLILHTLGSHQTYADRITTADEVFTPYCKNPDVAKCPTEMLINAFDNTIIALDKMLYELIQTLQNKKAILIYVSDHGESLGENGNYFHGKPIHIAPKEQFNIPMIFWLSDKFLATLEGQKMQRYLQYHLQQNTHVSHDHVFHSMLGCAGITSNNGGIDQQLNLCHHPNNH